MRETDTKEGWEQFKRLVLSFPSKAPNELYDLATKLKETRPIKELIETFLSLAFSSNNCERTFSRYNLIKTDIRSKLNTNTINSLLTIGLNGPGIQDFNFNISVN